MTKPSLSTIKKLFAVSCNTCAYQTCEEKLSDPKWESVKADICHIAGKKPGSARYDPTMADEERDAYENLILLCPNHHRRIDSLTPNEFDAEDLLEMKQAAEKGCTKRDWAPDDDLYEFALQALTLLDIANPPASPSITAPTPAARLIAELEDKKVYIKNIGEDDALNVTVEVDDDTAFRLNDTTWPVMSPGAKVFTALHSQALGRSNTGTFHLRWTDSNGQTREGRFPLG